jgi:integrase
LLRQWQPLDLSHFDRSIQLSLPERTALRSLGWNVRRLRNYDTTRPEWPDIHRLLLPLDAAIASLRCGADTVPSHRYQRDAASLVLHRCSELGISFWGWTEPQWRDLIGNHEQAFIRPWPKWVNRSVRPYVLSYAYLLGGYATFHFVGLVSRVDLARRVFGAEPVEAAIKHVCSVLRGWGYRLDDDRPGLRSTICQLLLSNRSPYLSDLSETTFQQLRNAAALQGGNASEWYSIHRALGALGYLLPPPAPVTRRIYESEPAIAEWMGWVDRWREISTLVPRVTGGYRSMLTQAGRWLVAENIAAQSPEFWTREICAAWVARVNSLEFDDCTRPPASPMPRSGRPLNAATKDAYLCATRRFFRDCQEWGWIRRHFNPTTAFATPKTIRQRIGANPRVISDDIWAKLLWAGVTLSTADLPDRFGRNYPFEMLGAVTMTWLFGGLRADELVRLRLGCIRWQREEEGAPASCLLDVPVNKTGPAFTKPVDPLLGHAVSAWETVRPAQPPLPDRKTGEHVNLLFAYRHRRVSTNFINDTIIPILCRKAGIPREDVRGRITSHRARSTIATQLYNAKEPMTLFELQAWLGHRSPYSTQRYTRITPTKLARAYNDAGYFARNIRTIEVLIDRDAVQNGEATSGGQSWQYYDLGHGYCGYTFFEQCPHRMACARCDFYTPKDNSVAQLIEAKAGSQRMLTQISLTDDERTAVENDAHALDHLLTKLSDTATPAGPTPRQLGNRPHGENG